MEELTRKRHAGFISAISRADLTEKIMSNDRICSRHFISGKPASPLDENNSDWLPTLNMGHSKKISESRARAVAERWERMKARESLNKESEVRNTEVLSDADDANLNSVDVSTQTALTSRMIEDMQEKTEDKSMQVFTEKSFMMNGEEYVKPGDISRKLQQEGIKATGRGIAKFLAKFIELASVARKPWSVRIYTGLTNFEVLHAVFDFVVPPATVKRVCVDNYQIEARSSI